MTAAIPRAWMMPSPIAPAGSAFPPHRQSHTHVVVFNFFKPVADSKAMPTEQITLLDLPSKHPCSTWSRHPWKSECPG